MIGVTSATWHERSDSLAPTGKRTPNTEIGFRELTEPWSSYLLDNGTTIRFKHIMHSVYESDNLRDSEGNPLYHIEGNSTVVIAVHDAGGN